MSTRACARGGCAYTCVSLWVCASVCTCVVCEGGTTRSVRLCMCVCVVAGMCQHASLVRAQIIVNVTKKVDENSPPAASGKKPPTGGAGSAAGTEVPKDIDGGTMAKNAVNNKKNQEGATPGTDETDEEDSDKGETQPKKKAKKETKK